MRKFLLFIVLSIFLISCSKENDNLEAESNALESVMKSSNNLSDLYFDLIKNHFTNPKDFDNLPLTTKINLYKFKYELFLNDNTLTSDQIEAVEDLIAYVVSLEFEDYDLSNESVIAIYSNFDYEQGTFLLGHLGNSPGDYNPPVETEGCWWCYRVGEITAPCHMEYRGGQPIGFYQTATMHRHGAFGIRNPSADIANVLIPCD